MAARYFRCTFELPAGAAGQTAVVHVAADDRATVWVNGQELGTCADWHQLARFDATAAIRPGQTNVLAIRAENSPAPVKENPAGLIAVLEVQSAGQPPLRISTDAAWRVSDKEAVGWRDVKFDDAAWPQAQVAAAYGQGPWGRFDANPAACTPQVCGIPDPASDAGAAPFNDRLRVIYLLDPRGVTVEKLAPTPLPMVVVRSGDRRSLAASVDYQ